jgi:hypothetical protein
MLSNDATSEIKIKIKNFNLKKWKNEKKRKKKHWEGGINCSSDGPDYTRSSAQISAPAQFEYLSEE